ncbi:MAG: hypothetical protein OEY57_17665 [Nitrospirota bacterium]|nr:hypothetical protein [Nitrospirota bacterium]
MNTPASSVRYAQTKIVEVNVQHSMLFRFAPPLFVFAAYSLGKARVLVD